MKKLFGDNTVARLRTVPTFVWVLFLYLSFYFAHAYEYLVLGEYVAETYREVYTQLGYEPQTFSVLFGVLSSTLSALFSTLFYELILFITHGIVARRFRAEINRADYKFRLRYLMMLINLVVGVLALPCFFTIKTADGFSVIRIFRGVVNYTDSFNPYYLIISSIVPVGVISLFVPLFYEDFRKRFVPANNQAKLFAYYALIYVGIEVVLFVVDVVRSLLSKNVKFSDYDIAGMSVEGGMFVAIGVCYFFYWRRLRKAKDAAEPEIRILEENDTPDKGGNIYDDFGF